MGWFIPFLVSFAMSVVAYLLAPKPKAPKPPAAQDMEGPTADADREMPVLFGTMTIKGLNIAWWGNKGKHEYEVDA